MTGRGSTVGGWLCGNPDVHAITLTGSTEVGIETAKTAADHLAHIALELGGNDAFIVLEDGDVDLAAEELIWGRMYNTGQVCCASKRFLIHESLAEAFTEKAVAKIKALRQGMPSDESTQIGCLISEKAAIGSGETDSAHSPAGRRDHTGGGRKGAFVEPTVIRNVPKTADVATDMEIFGPVVPVITFKTTEGGDRYREQLQVRSLRMCVHRKYEEGNVRMQTHWSAAGPSSTAPASSEASRCRSEATNIPASAQKA